MKEITLQVDDAVFNRLSDEIRQRRMRESVHATPDLFLIRLFDAMSQNTKTMLLTMKDNRISIRNFMYDDNRQARK